MNKLILAFTLGFAPFLSLAFNNIFENPSLDKGSPEFDSSTKFGCSARYNGTDFYVEKSTEGEPSLETMQSECQPSVKSFFVGIASFPYGCPLDHAEWGAELTTLKLFYYGGIGCNSQPINNLTFTFTTGIISSDISAQCPPDSNTALTYPNDVDGDGSPDECYSPEQLNLNDSCNISSGNEIIDVAVTSPQGCFTQDDGSSCSYKAVTTLGGQQYYAMDLEGDCYSGDHENLDGNILGDVADVPLTTEGEFQCTSEGGLLTCAEDEADYTNEDGTPVDPCGTVNGVFACVDSDLDGDTLPDYLDPDIDGDGIANGLDLDADGNGMDDPIQPNNGSGSGTGEGFGDLEINVDMTPVVNKLDEIKDSLTKTTVTTITEPTEDAASFYESEYEDGIEGIWDDFSAGIQTTEMNSFLETFKNVPSGGSMDYSMCFDLGSMGNYGCGDLAANPIIWAAIRIFILVTAGFLCRRIVFGG